MAASRQSYEVRALGPHRYMVFGSFRPQAASALVNLDTAPSRRGDRGFSVVRTSTGLYTVTFTEKWKDMESCFVSVRKADGAVCTVQGGDYVAASKTLQIRTLGPAAGTGYIPLDITTLKLPSGDVIINTTEGGLPDGNTAPSLQRVNSATDKALRVIWAATSVVEVQFAPVAIPPDYDNAQDMEVHLLVGKGSNTDTAAVIDVQAWSGLGDTEMGGNTAALATATITEYSRALTGANVGAHPGFLNLGLVPGAHDNDALHLYGAWLEYASTKGGGLVDLADDVDNRVSFCAVFRNTVLGGAAAT